MKLALLMGAKPDAKEKADPARDYAREAFSALKEDDEEGFIEAFLGAVRACKAKAKPMPMHDDEEEDDDSEDY
jgi:hypothetical protein